MAFWKKKKQKVSISSILKDKTGQDAIIEIDDILSTIFYDNPESLTKQELTIVYIEELEREINNGGFNQFFFNSTGNYYIETLKALKDINSVFFYDLLVKSSGPFPNGKVPNDMDQRQVILEEIEDEAEKQWSKLEQEFYTYQEDIYGLLINYIKKNIDAFR